MADDLRASIALLAAQGVGVGGFWRLVARFGRPSEVLACPVDVLSGAGVPEPIVTAIVIAGSDPMPGSILRAVAAAGARAICFLDAEYPKALRFIFDPPPVLYLRGGISAADSEAVAVVGSRSASGYGLDSATWIATGLARRGVTVVSGLARGIDTAAHRAALGAGGRTIAVLGNGIDRVYPVRNAGLASEIEASGAVISELPPGVPAAAFRFPQRNRIVSGLSLAVVVVEAGARSGSLITARLAAEQGREVCAVPGRIRSPETRGAHRLLQDGAALVESGEDVIAAAIPWRFAEGAGETSRPGGLLGRLPGSGARRHLDELAKESELPTARLLEELLDLELRGFIVRHAGMYFSRKP